MAGNDLSQIVSPVLLIVGGNDFGVIELNEDAFAQLRCTKNLVIVPGATHLFEERGTLEQVAEHAADWFKTHLIVTNAKKLPAYNSI
ncbi:MAG: phosphoribosyltransferase [Sporomusa sp.]|nr:phosphoribosyltransferase [Sporomusa sp.]